MRYLKSFLADPAHTIEAFLPVNLFQVGLHSKRGVKILPKDVWIKRWTANYAASG